MTPPATARVRDTQCGFKLFSRPTLTHIIPHMHMDGWIFDVEMIAREVNARRGTDLPRASTIIYEFPLTVWRDVAGSKIKPGDWFVVGANLWRIYFKYMWPRRG